MQQYRANLAVALAAIALASCAGVHDENVAQDAKASPPPAVAAKQATAQQPEAELAQEPIVVTGSRMASADYLWNGRPARHR